MRTLTPTVLLLYVFQHEISTAVNSCSLGVGRARGRPQPHLTSGFSARGQHHTRMTLTGLNPAQMRTAKAKQAIGRQTFNGILKGKTLIKSSTPQRDYHIALASDKHEALLDEREPGISDEFSRRMSGNAPLDRTERVWPRRAVVFHPDSSLRR